MNPKPPKLPTERAPGKKKRRELLEHYILHAKRAQGGLSVAYQALLDMRHSMNQGHPVINEIRRYAKLQAVLAVVYEASTAFCMASDLVMQLQLELDALRPKGKPKK